METLHGIINEINSFLWTYVIIVALIGSGIVFTLRTKFATFSAVICVAVNSESFADIFFFFRNIIFQFRFFAFR